MSENFTKSSKKANPVAQQSRYEHVAEHRLHHQCLFEHSGLRCGKPATFLTTSLASKVNAGHESQLRGGYCKAHYLQVVRKESPKKPTPAVVNEQPWRDFLRAKWLTENPEYAMPPAPGTEADYLAHIKQRFGGFLKPMPKASAQDMP